VRLEKMHRQNRHCDDLIEKTAVALNDDIVTLMLLAVQKGNLELSVKTALKQVHSHAGFGVRRAKIIVQKCLYAFPYIWVFDELWWSALDASNWWAFEEFEGLDDELFWWALEAEHEEEAKQNFNNVCMLSLSLLRVSIFDSSVCQVGYVTAHYSKAHHHGSYSQWSSFGPCCYPYLDACHSLTFKFAI